MSARMISWTGAVAGIALLGLPVASSAQGFGVFKKTVTLTRSLPPVIDLSGTRVALRVSGIGSRPSPTSELIRAKLVPLIFSNSSLAENADNPDRVIEVNLTDFQTNSRVDPQDRARVVTGTIRAAYRTIDNRTKQSLDASNLAYDYDRRFAGATAPAPATRNRGGGGGLLGAVGQALGKAVAPNPEPDDEQPPSVPQLTTLMVEALAVQVGQRIVLTKQSIDVPLPRGKLDHASDYARAGRWGAMLEELEQTTPLPGPDDSYRLYGIGVANEALAYQETDGRRQRDLIAGAAQQYKAALRLKPDDDVFRSSENRIAESLAALDRSPEPQGGAPSGAGSNSRAATQPGTTSASQWTNAAVIDLYKEGFKEAELAEAIRTASNPTFDVDTPAGLLQLKRAGIPDTVIRAMRARMEAAVSNGNH